MRIKVRRQVLPKGTFTKAMVEAEVSRNGKQKLSQSRGTLVKSNEGKKKRRKEKKTEKDILGNKG